MDCPKCNYQVDGKYCSNCGRPVELPRINGQYIQQEIGSVLSLQKGIFLTIWELLLRPGKNVRSFLREDRNRLMKPILFVIICSVVYSIAQQLLHFEDEYVNSIPEVKDSVILNIFEWIQRNYGYANIIIAFFIAFWTKLLFRKIGYNFFEILVLLFFVIGVGMLIYLIFGITESITNLKLFYIGGLIGVIYTAWAVVQFFGANKIVNYMKVILAYFLGILSFSISIVVLGTIIEIIMKQ